MCANAFHPPLGFNILSRPLSTDRGTYFVRNDPQVSSARAAEAETKDVLKERRSPRERGRKGRNLRTSRVVDGDGVDAGDGDGDAARARSRGRVCAALAAVFQARTARYAFFTRNSVSTFEQLGFNF